MTPSPERQSTLDEHIRSRIQSEVKQLRKVEEQVQQEIQLALNKENLDREKAMAGEVSGEQEAGVGSVKSSAALAGDLEEIRSKIERFQSRKSLADYPELKADQDALVTCFKCVAFSCNFIDLTQSFRSNLKSSLECWKEVANFRHSVAQLEKVRMRNYH